MASAAPKQNVGNYVIERPLARGSMGHVYVAHHMLTHARVALKVLRAELTADAQAEERFLREVRAAARIGHEGIVRVYDAGRSDDGQLYLAMELLEGETLEQRLRRTPGERASAMQWLHAVLEPLSAAHAHGIVHRDLKPANVFIARDSSRGGEERVKLLDFGLARDMHEKSVTATGIALGTPYYMSPEQASEPRKVAPPSDVWSVGVMMYEVLCGAMPFDGETLHAVVIQSSVAPHVPARARAPELDARLTDLIDRCLSKEPSARPADARALRAELEPLLAAQAVQDELAKPVSITTRTHVAGSLEESSQDSHMPFAETAYSLPTLSIERELESDRPGARRPTRGGAASDRGMLSVWLFALGLLLVAGLALAWLLGREPATAAPSEVTPLPASARGPAATGTPKTPVPANNASSARPTPAPPSLPPTAATKHNGDVEPAPLPVGGEPPAPEPPAPSDPSALANPGATPSDSPSPEPIAEPNAAPGDGVEPGTNAEPNALPMQGPGNQPARTVEHAPELGPTNAPEPAP